MERKTATTTRGTRVRGSRRAGTASEDDDCPHGKPYRDPQIDYQARTAIKNKARWLKMLRKANLLQEVAKQAAEQLRPGPAGAGPPAAAPAPVLA